MRSRWFFVVPFVLLMLWFLVILRFSPYFHGYILGHYELAPTTNEEITGLSPAQVIVWDMVNNTIIEVFPTPTFVWVGVESSPALIWVANNTMEVLERAAIIVGLETILLTIVSFVIYKAADESFE